MTPHRAAALALLAIAATLPSCVFSIGGSRRCTKTSASAGLDETAPGPLAEFRAANRGRLAHLQVGMPRADALGILDGASVWGGDTAGEITNPYRTEGFTSTEGQPVEVRYYYTDLVNRDGAITDDELTPVLFEGGKVAGWGRSARDAMRPSR